jgi:uncharacterized protein (UPF0332 family)
LEAKTHAGVVHLFHAELVRPGLFPASHNRSIASLQRSREFADYDAAVTFTQADAEALLADARALEADTRSFLREQGLLA